MVSSCDYSEKAAHLALASYRVTGNREFFRVSVKKAIELILPTIGDYKIHDVKEAHGIEQIRIEVDRREREKREADQAKKWPVSRKLIDAKRNGLQNVAPSNRKSSLRNSG